MFLYLSMALSSFIVIIIIILCHIVGAVGSVGMLINWVSSSVGEGHNSG